MKLISGPFLYDQQVVGVPTSDAASPTPAGDETDSLEVEPNMAGYLALKSMEENGESRYFVFSCFFTPQAGHKNTYSPAGVSCLCEFRV